MLMREPAQVRHLFMCYREASLRGSIKKRERHHLCSQCRSCSVLCLLLLARPSDNRQSSASESLGGCGGEGVMGRICEGWQQWLLIKKMMVKSDEARKGKRGKRRARGGMGNGLASFRSQGRQRQQKDTRKKREIGKTCFGDTQRGNMDG